MFRPFPYERRNADGSLWQRYTVRRTLCGYTIAWALHTEYYDEGAKSCEGLMYSSPIRSDTKLRGFKYWLPDGTSVAQREWMEFNFDSEVADCSDLEWER